MSEIPDSHPRAESLRIRNKIVQGVKDGITSQHGLLAHGRGEAFDYLIGEKTTEQAKKAIEAAVALLLKAKRPVISVNGNAAALVGKELVELSEVVPALLEVNIFHSSREREHKIRKHLNWNGARKVLMPSNTTIDVDHNRKYVNPEGIDQADVVFVPLEDGDRCEALVKMDKKVITVDLNPMSRTSQAATITIIDNIVRTMPLLIEKVKELKGKELKFEFDNKENLQEAVKSIKYSLT